MLFQLKFNIIFKLKKLMFCNSSFYNFFIIKLLNILNNFCKKMFNNLTQNCKILFLKKKVVKAIYILNFCVTVTILFSFIFINKIYNLIAKIHNTNLLYSCIFTNDSVCSCVSDHSKRKCIKSSEINLSSSLIAYIIVF